MKEGLVTKRSADQLGDAGDQAPESGRRAGLWPTRARLWDITAEGQVLAVWRGGPPRPVLIAGMSHDRVLAGVRARHEVLLTFLDGDPEQPVIAGELHASLDLDPQRTAAREPVLELAAERELVLRCGESAIVLRADGRVEIRGADIEAISSSALHLRGGYVGIN